MRIIIWLQLQKQFSFTVLGKNTPSRPVRNKNVNRKKYGDKKLLETAFGNLQEADWQMVFVHSHSML